jgi:hypothetical protein
MAAKDGEESRKATRSEGNDLEEICSGCVLTMYLQFVDHGYKVMHAGQLITVFSARNYLDVQSNDSALLLIALDSDEKMRIRSGSCSLDPIPSCLILSLLSGAHTDRRRATGLLTVHSLSVPSVLCTEKATTRQVPEVH